MSADSMVVLVPTKGRPHNVHRLCSAWDDTSADCDLIFLFDLDDPSREDSKSYVRQAENPHIGYQEGGPSRIGPWLNWIGPAIVEVNGPRSIIGFMGDDHVPQTDRWDRQISAALYRCPGIAYGNDLFQGPNLPTAVFMTGAVIQATGYMVPPTLQHMYLDNAWREWGTGAGCLTYLPNVVIEHLHPHAGKAQGDETYSEVWPYMTTDQPAWNEYIKAQCYIDVAKIKLRLSQLVHEPQA